ncbi:MAG: ribulose-phosphate 3-epimerase [Patescibacteria group bacterium]|nr:MAG: ribulose-phosphate 3-epimerase [Patescibacteria group bacterium]
MIIPAILEKNIEEIKRKIGFIDGRCEFIQIDIADGKFLSESSYASIENIAAIEPISKLEIHLMAENPELFVEERYPSIFKISAHIETKGIENFIRNAVAKKYIVGVSVSPETPLETIDNLPGGISFVQFLTARPGKQGNQIIKEVFPKISVFRQNHPGVRIQADGGINESNLQEVLNLGVDDVVIGSAIFDSQDPAITLARFREVKMER